MRKFIRHSIDGSIECPINNLFTHFISQYPWKMPKNLNQIEKYRVAMRVLEEMLNRNTRNLPEKLGLTSATFIIK